MVKDRIGEVFEYEGVIYTVGEWIVGTENSDYHGLPGVITELSDEEGELDIYCTFAEPEDPEIIARIEKRFSYIFDRQQTLNDIPLEDISMNRDEIEFVTDKPACYTPETNIPYPLCVGNHSSLCKHCSFYRNPTNKGGRL